VEYKPELAKSFIDFISSRVKNVDAWIDEVSTVAYQLHNPTRKPARFHIHYESDGGSGKTFATIGMAKLYGNFAFINIQPSASKDQFNDWLSSQLYIAFEEAETDNYTDKEMNAYVKRFTNTDLGVRAMRTSLTKGKNYAIGVLCTNDAGLYGLLRADEAVKRRLVVVLFKKNNMNSEQWSVYENIIKDDSFGFSLYTYIYNEWYSAIADNYNPNCFVSDYDVYSELKSFKKSSVESFNELLTVNKENYLYFNQQTNRTPHYDLVFEYQGEKISYYFIDRSTAITNFNLHAAQSNRNKMTDQSFIAEMNTLGWSYDRKKMHGDLKFVFYRSTFDHGGDNDSN
jgi:hypothetical protein